MPISFPMSWIQAEPPSPVQERIETARAGVALTAFMGLATFGYVAATWTEPNRAWLAAFAGLACAIGVVMTVAPLDVLLSDRWVSLTWLSWSLSLVAATAAGVALDDGRLSPFVLVFALPLMFAALSYPLRIALVVCACDLVACSIALIAFSNAGAGYVELVLCTLAGAAALCVWQANRNERRQRYLNALSRTDPLTGCANRRAFTRTLATSVERHTRDGTAFSLLLFDLDDFKRTNDEAGHAVGDELLRWAAAQAQAILRPGDEIARIGGDEFAAVIAGADPAEGRRVEERLVEALASRSPATAGLACCPRDGTEADVLYRAADIRLYEAKRQRPNLVGV